jgi:hypothetical protein
MSPATRSNTAAQRSSRAMSSCSAVSGNPLQDPAMRPGGAVGRRACLGSQSIQPGGARVSQANAQTLGSGLTPRCSELDSELPVRRREAALGTPRNRRTRETHRVEPQRMDHLMPQPRPVMQQRRTRQTLPATSAIAHRTLSTPHARATSCLMSTCRQARS